MKKLIYLVFAIFATLTIKAQSLTIQPAIDACLDMRKAMEKGGADQLLKAAADKLDKAGVKEFGVLKLVGTQPSLDGHYVFSSKFARDLIADRGVIKFARRYRKDSRRGSSTGGTSIYLKNGVVQANGSTKYLLNSRNVQEIAVVTEPNGLVTLRITDIDNKQYYHDTKNETAGEPYRVHVLNLTSKTTTLEIEIINTGSADTSFAIIGN